MQLFYTTNIHPPYLTLSPEESKHCIQVLRHQVGDSLNIVDGLGNWYEGQISEANPKACEVKITHQKEAYQKLPVRIHLVVAPTKNSTRFEWLLEKATEIGVTDITPLFCQRSERPKVREDRLQKVLVAAMKQSLKAYLPELHPAIKISKWWKQENLWNSFNKRYIAAVIEKEQTLKANYQGGDTLIMIGPEGGFTNQELQMGQANGFAPVSLGPTRLRTETAGIVACHTINLFNQ